MKTEILEGGSKKDHPNSIWGFPRLGRQKNCVKTQSIDFVSASQNSLHRLQISRADLCLTVMISISYDPSAIDNGTNDR
jgi:hypothetical protein